MARLKRPAAAAVLLAAVAFLLWTGVQNHRKQTPHQATVFAMDTVMTLTLYGDGAVKPGEECLNDNLYLIRQLEQKLSAADEDSLIWAVNHGAGERMELPGDVGAMLARALELCGQTGGALDITAYPAVQAWGFTTGEYRVPGGDELAALAEQIDYTRMELTDLGENWAVTLPEGMALDLGAVAKGELGDLLRAFFKGDGVSSALLDLGQSSIVAIGSKPNGDPWRIGLQDPGGEGYLGVLELTDEAMGTSGSYQRYFEQDGLRYCHIIDPETAAPARSGLASVTVVAPSCLTCDALSTALFVMGLEEAAAFWRETGAPDFEAIFVEENGTIHITAGLEGDFSLAEGYEDREVRVIS